MDMEHGLKRRGLAVAPTPHRSGSPGAAVDPRRGRPLDRRAARREAEADGAGWWSVLARFVDVELLLLLILFFGLPLLAVCVLSSE